MRHLFLASFWTLLILMPAACGKTEPVESSGSTPAAGEKAGKAAAPAQPRAGAETRSGKAPDDDDPAPRVELVTSLGRIVVELDRKRAPRTVENFLRYVEDGHYEGTVFHRVIRDFMIQGGGFTVDGRKKPTRPPIPLEADNGLSNVRGTIAMARTSDPDSATAQFYINVVDNRALDPRPGRPGYTVFGKVVEGMNVVDEIRNLPTTARGRFANWPKEPVVIRKARRL